MRILLNTSVEFERETNIRIHKTYSFVTKSVFINLYYHKEKEYEIFSLITETIVAARNSDTLLFQGYKTHLIPLTCEVC